jgi:3-phenylpropionate/trans-cinnamate dioxygenase ferredoxin reductase subunit
VVERAGTVLVVGSSLAGLRACEQLRALGHAGRIVLVGAEAGLPYDRPPLSKRFLAGRLDEPALALCTREHLESLQLDARLGVRASALDVEGRRCELEDGSEVAFDGVVIATGATPRTLPGARDLKGVHTLRSRGDALALRDALGEPSVRLVVVGGGFLGMEVAGTARELGCEVTVVEPLAEPLGRVLAAELGAALRALHERRGVVVRTGVGVRALAGEGHVEAVELTDGSRLPADVVLVAIGVVPEVDWLAGSGLRLEDGVVCDAALLAAPGVAAAGDVARWPHPAARGLVRLEHWTNAAEQGAHAAASLLAEGAPPPYVPVPYFWSDHFDTKVQALGLPMPEDDVEVIDGSLASGRFVACCVRAGRLSGVVGFGRPRQVTALRPLVARGAPLAEARSLLVP